ncbi:MAG: hypothetical protein HC937_03385 [Aquincola sp.]|nr:hypothetical protein [Aquincola sp.]
MLEHLVRDGAVTAIETCTQALASGEPSQFADRQQKPADDKTQADYRARWKERSQQDLAGGRVSGQAQVPPLICVIDDLCNFASPTLGGEGSTALRASGIKRRTPTHCSAWRRGRPGGDSPMTPNRTFGRRQAT